MKKYFMIILYTILPFVFSALLFYNERYCLKLNYGPSVLAYFKVITSGVLIGVFLILMLYINNKILLKFKKGKFISVIGLIIYPVICMLLTVLMIMFEIAIPTNGFILNLIVIVLILGWQYSLKHIIALIILTIYLNYKKSNNKNMSLAEMPRQHGI